MTNVSKPAIGDDEVHSRTLWHLQGEIEMMHFPDGYPYLIALKYGEGLVAKSQLKFRISDYMLVGPHTEVLYWHLNGPFLIQFTRLGPQCLALKNGQSTNRWKNRLEVIKHSIYQTMYEFNQSDGQSNAEPGRNFPPILGMDLESKRQLYSKSASAGLAHPPKIKVSTRYLEKQFAYWIGISPTQFLKCLKIRSASEMLLETKPSIGAIAKSLGYYDTSHLYKDFKSIAHVSPSSFVKNTPHRLFSIWWENGSSAQPIYQEYMAKTEIYREGYRFSNLKT